jgi:AcrR family transcriptional regulator
VNEARRAAQRERILAAAERLLVTHGAERSRLRDVSEAAGVSVGTVQHYFDTRDRLIAELFDWSNEKRLRAWTASVPVDGDPWQRVVTLLLASVPEPLIWRSRVWIEFVAMARDDELRARLGDFYDAWRPPFRKAIEDGIEAGAFHPTAPVADIVDLFVILGDGAAVALSLEAPGVSLEQLQRVFIETARGMLGVERPPTRAGAPAVDAAVNSRVDTDRLPGHGGQVPLEPAPSHFVLPRAALDPGHGRRPPRRPIHPEEEDSP